MDPTRISIARVLALDVPLSWQEAVAVTHEAAVLSEVNAAMNARPSLVTAESCFITKDGAVELPDTTEHESPEDVARLLRELLAGRDAPDEVEALAYGVAVHELSSDLAALPAGNRRAHIAKLATRAIAAETAPPTSAFDAPAARPESPRGAHGPLEPATTPSTPPRPVLVSPRAQRPPFVATPSSGATMRPPFVAAPAESSAAATARALDVPAAPPTPEPASDAELERLRRRTVERDRASGLFAALRRALPWLTWRSDSADPRVLGGAAVVIAALVAVVWRGQGATPPTPPGGDAAAAVSTAAPAASTSAAAATPAVANPASPTTPPALPSIGAASNGRERRATSTASASDRAPIVIGPADGATAGPTGAAVSPTAPASTTAPPATPSPAPTSAEPPRRVVAAPTTPAAPARASSRQPLYAAGDAGVTAPVMLRQQLPSPLEPNAAVPDDWPFLELIIDERGAVEAVRLRAPSLAPGQTLYRHRMLLAAAKAWQFDPATRDGVPVRYLLRVPLEP